jgi:membrane fusion protein (multidrug efflux system)
MKRIQQIVCLAALLLTASCKHEESHKEEQAMFPVTNPMRIDTTIYNEYVCQIHSHQRIEIRALEKGYLEKIYVDEGQFVRKGQLMFQIMPTIYQAELQKAQAEVNYAQIEYQNTKTLAGNNIVSPNELALAQARLDKAKAEAALAQTHLNFTEIRAPFDGIMDHLEVRLGSLVDEGELLTSLSDNSKMWVYYNVPEAEYLEYARKAKTDSMKLVKLRMANGEEFEYPGKVETIEADFNNETGNIEFRATFQNPEGLLRHGETGDILMPVMVKNALIIPQKTTFEVLDKKFVFVIDKKGIVNSREIRVALEIPHLYVISDGLEEGEMVLVEGLRKVKNKESIRYKLEDPKQVISELTHLHAE